MIYVIHMGYVMTISNQKGGVGKTTTAVNLSTGLAACHKKTLLIDLDPQANATTGLNTESHFEKTSYHVLWEPEEIRNAVVNTLIPGLYLLPSNADLSAGEMEFASFENKNFRLKQALELIKDEYDLIIIDCPPALGTLTINALVAADGVLIPLQAEYYALEGLSNLLKTIDRVKAHYHPSLTITGILITMYDKRNSLSLSIENDVKKHFARKVFYTVIPRNVKLSEAPSHGIPAILYDVNSAGARAYIQLSKEILDKLFIH